MDSGGLYTTPHNDTIDARVHRHVTLKTKHMITTTTRHIQPNPITIPEFQPRRIRPRPGERRLLHAGERGGLAGPRAEAPGGAPVRD